MSAQEVGSNCNKNVLMVQVWHKRSVAPFSECIGYLLMLQASLDEALKLMPLQGLCMGFFSGMMPTPHAAACELQPGFPDAVPVLLPVTSRGSRPSSGLFPDELVLLPRQSFASSNL